MQWRDGGGFPAPVFPRAASCLNEKGDVAFMLKGKTQDRPKLSEPPGHVHCLLKTATQIP
jgi:hypothetical protein